MVSDTALEKKIDTAENEIEQMKAALGVGTFRGPNPYAVAEDWTRDELKERLSALTADLTALRREKNLLLEKQGTESKKKIKLLNEETERVEVWTVKGQADMQSRLLRSNMDL
eukprot:CAMPEP_0118895456 /NCGR_PEP_ID=MMETSP1166-20130328/3803_1 /TAXON_ID=1104430 /ORGANISM="Chrysoreinhardia sp, Strain CCMP3193" /LENGTH=112 /DNA_ID=CAMNT_0006834485 /DNA_START=57 /DNA_END=392 /DNA_ORIENTATION=-